jgi:hypothetical protein
MPTARRAATAADVTELLNADRKEVKAIFREINAIQHDGEDEEKAAPIDTPRSGRDPAPSMSKRINNASHDVELIAKAERLLNRVLGYQAAIAVHQLKDELGLDVEELTLSVMPMTSEAVGAFRVVCTIVRASGPEPLVLEVIVAPEKAIAGNGEGSAA